MQSYGAAGDLEAQLARKEREWKELQSLRVLQLESSLRGAQDELSVLRQRFQQLRDDFRYNLTVLEERDRELEKYDAKATRVQATETARQEEVSQLRIQVAKLQEQREKEEREREEERRRSHQRAAEHRLQLERLQGCKDGDIQKQREAYEGMKRDLQHRLQEVEGELALQKQELMADFDNELRLREHEFNLRMDEMRAVVLAHKLKVKLLSKEAEVLAQTQLQTQERLTASEELCQNTHTLLQRRQLEIQDITAVKDSRIRQLEEQLRKMEARRRTEEQACNRKHEDLDRAVREREAQLEALRGAHSSQLGLVETQSSQLQSQLDAMAAHTRRAQREQAEALAHRDKQIERLHTELETTRTGWDTYITQVSKETVVKDTELLALQEREAKLRTELERSRGEAERYKQQLGLGVEREKALEQRRVQLELEWQRRCEDLKAEHYLASEGLIQGLTQARDQAAAELRERERELQDVGVLLHTVTAERDQALQGTRPGQGVASLPSEELRLLQQQNSSLRAVVAQMRWDMEVLSQQRSPAPAPPPAHPRVPGDFTSTLQPAGPPAKTTDSSVKTSPAGYTEAMEEQLSEVKARCRQLEEQLDGATRALIPPTDSLAPPLAPLLDPISADNAYLQNHIRSLNETIGGLRVVKVALTAALRKHEVRVAHLESAMASLTQQCHSKQVEGEELRLELANQKRSWKAEEAGLHQKLVAVEMELAEVRREKEEYQKGSILTNLETVALGNQVSALKMDIASRREPIVCEQSEMVHELQEENLRLRQQQLLSLGSGVGLGAAQGSKPSAPLPETRLKQAARCIARLSRDKQQLIEMGNRLRSQLIHAGLEVPQPAPVFSPAPEAAGPERDRSGPGPERQQGRLSVLEQLQYQLTTQELQYAQREPRTGAPIRVQPLSHSEGGGRGPGRDRAANPWVQGSRDTHRQQRSRSKENTPPLLSQSPTLLKRDGASRSSSSPCGALVSSLATEGSLREVWQVLDRGPSPSVLTTPRLSSDTGDQVEMTRCELKEASPERQMRGLQGTRAPVQERRTTTRPSQPSAKIRNTKPTSRGGKIRNYNIKD
ncbi:coiled-coil domain-containing protein 57 isoform X2 [Hypomesus transpacificus]|uniref:coiled-coil domain-containing protein 57 isoform X2 n=1 Tax=Hypomesus transpacificus TaxID=137520 RepID=UPI001F087FAC|nr:coiled-coil domain-containing protein 57 isoform X2 [Hypomesus transpacificus]